MSIPTWPAELPCPTRAGYLSQRKDTRMPKSGNGPPGYRRRFSSTAQLVTLSIEVIRSGKAIFDDFYVETTQEGTLPFYMTNPTTDGTAMLTQVTAPILSTEGEPIVLASQWLCLFGDPVPSERVFAGRFEITFNVAVMP